MRIWEKLSGIEIWPEGDRWRWEILRYGQGGTRIVAKGTAATEASAWRAAHWRATRGAILVVLAAVAALVAVVIWLMH